MRKLLIFLVFKSIFFKSFAGGILTNTNQSAYFVGLQSRDASTDIDAVYYNPAGLNFISSENKLFISLNNQIINQERSVISNYQYLNNPKYVGKVNVPIFPGIYAAYKIDNLVISAGFNPIGGGGGAKYDAGLPSFEYGISEIAPSLQSLGYNVTDYSVNMSFEGRSIFMGYQLNFSYKINDKLSIALGVRMVDGKEIYQGYIKDIEINYNNTWLRADAFFKNLSSQAYQASLATGTTASNLQPLIDNGAGSLTLEEAQTNGYIDQTTRASLESGLTQLGVNPVGVTIQQAQFIFNQASATYLQKSQEASAKARLLRDQNADVTKRAFGFAPVISINFRPTSNLNIALKYEHRTELEFENHTKSDFTIGYLPSGDSITKFPDGQKSRLDLPAMFSAGFYFTPVNKVKLHGGFHYYFDKSANWEGRQDSLKHNMIELSAGIEYNLTEKLSLMSGFLYTKSGATNGYQTDLSYSTPTKNLGIGVSYKFTSQINFTLAASNTWYDTFTRSFNRKPGQNDILVNEKLSKKTLIIATGVEFRF